jgi:hypothetical protein
MVSQIMLRRAGLSSGKTGSSWVVGAGAFFADLSDRDEVAAIVEEEIPNGAARTNTAESHTHLFQRRGTGAIHPW